MVTDTIALRERVMLVIIRMVSMLGKRSIIDYGLLKMYCPYCDKKLSYVGYTAFTCTNCKKGFSINIKEHPKIQI